MSRPDFNGTEGTTPPPMIDGVPLVEYLTAEQREGMYQRAQRAWEATARRSIEEITPPDWDDAASFYVSLSLETDRAIPVLAFAFIDTEMERALRNVFNSGVAGGVGRLFGPLGPVGSASARINMVHALYWITDDAAHDLHVLRRIRNRFAHQRMPAGLEDGEIVDLLAAHRALPAMLGALLHRLGPDIDWDAPLPETVPIKEGMASFHLNARNKLIFASALTAWTVMSQLYVAPLAQRKGVHPAAIMGSESTEAPVGIRSQHEAFEPFVDGLLMVLLSPERQDSLPG